MPVIDFPSNPSNNELFIAQGKAMRYNANKNKWRQVTTLSSNQITDLENKTIGVSALSISGNTLVVQKDDSSFANVSLAPFAGNILTNYASASQLPTTGLVAGSQVYVTDTDSLFITDGSGWYKIATVNLSPSLSLGVSSISLGAGGSIDINYTVTEPEDTPFTVTASATSSASITVHQANNTITFDNPTVATSETITISATDGVNTVADTLTMSISLGPDWSTGGNYKFAMPDTGAGMGVDFGASVLTNRTYTYECWAQPAPASGEAWLLNQYLVVAGRTVHGSHNGKMASFVGGDGGWHDTTVDMGTDIAHFAWVSNGDGTTSMWKDGIFAGTANQGGSSVPPAVNTKIGSGNQGMGSVLYGFRLNTNRLYTGTGNFTPPALDGGLTNVAGTVALWDGQSAGMTDASGNQTFSVIGSPTFIQSNLRDILNGADANKTVTSVRKYGYGVEMDGANNRLAVADPSANGGLGMVDIYELENERWVYKQTLHAPQAGEDSGSQFFGQDVSLRGDYLAIGAPYADEGTWQGYGEFPSQAFTGAIYVYYRSGGTWSLQQKIKRVDLSHSKRFDNLGTRVHLMDDNGTGLICYNQHNYNTFTGGSGTTAYGQIHYVTRSGTTWSEAAPLGSSNVFRPANHHDLSSQYWGNRLDGDGNGDRIITSSYRAGGMGTPTNSGRVFIFTRSGSTFTEEVELAEPTPTLNSRFGSSVAINAAGDECAIAAHGATVGSTTRVGAVYIYTRSGSTWSLQQKVHMSGTPIAETNFGGKDHDNAPLNQIRLAGDYLYVTAELDDGHFTDAGALYVFKRSGTTWTQQAKIYVSTGMGSGFHSGQTLAGIGASESLPNYVVVGAPSTKGDANGSNSTKGKVFVFKADD